MAASDGSGAIPPVPIEQYTPEALSACEKALRTILAKVGAWGPKLVLFGGLAPRFLVKTTPPGLPEHTGTTDLDVVIGVQIEVDEPGVYTKLQQELRNAEFRPSETGSYAWERLVDGVLVVLEFFCPAEPDEKPGTLKRNPGGSAGSAVSAIRLKGAELGGADCSAHLLSGELLDHGGHREVEVRVVNILPFLVLKAFALESRDKEKDAYDLVWILTAYGEDGPRSAAEEAVKSPVVEDERVEEAMAVLEEAFRDVEAQARATTPGSSSAERAAPRTGECGCGVMRWARSMRSFVGGGSSGPIGPSRAEEGASRSMLMKRCSSTERARGSGRDASIFAAATLPGRALVRDIELWGTNP